MRWMTNDEGFEQENRHEKEKANVSNIGVEWMGSDAQLNVGQKQERKRSHEHIVVFSSISSISWMQGDAMTKAKKKKKMVGVDTG